MDDFIVGSDVSQISIHSSQDVLSDAESFEDDERKRKSSRKDTKMDKKRKRKEKKEQTNWTDKRGRRSNRVEKEARGGGGGCQQKRQRKRLIQASSSQGLSSDASQDDDGQDARLREEIPGCKANVNHSREDRALNTGVHSASRESKARLHKIILNSDSENDGKYPGAPSQKGNTPRAVLQASKQKHACTKRRVPSSESEEDCGGKQTREKRSMEEARLSENAAKRKKERDPDVRGKLVISPRKRRSSLDEVESNRYKTHSNSKRRQHDAHSPGIRSPRARPSHTPDRKTRGQSQLAATLADMGIDPLKDPQFAAEIAVSAHIPCCIGCHRIV